jgi:hypothetical protein
MKNINNTFASASYYTNKLLTSVFMDYFNDKGSAIHIVSSPWDKYKNILHLLDIHITLINSQSVSSMR